MCPSAVHAVRLLALLAVALGLTVCTPKTRSQGPDDRSAGLRFQPGGAVAKDAEEDDEKPKWDVDAPPGPTAKVKIDTDEGTWLSLDVSPDGREIVFDLLGDIYVIPIAGGDAKSLTSGMAWDMQPRFSPDGRFIAFTSDRGGGDNVWVMRRDGSDPKAVTSEDFRLINSPTWSPDGQFIAARKHFTAERSLGSGEIWLFHISGGKGLQMTEKPNDQKDVGEPAFSPDGKFVYFSQDTTAGETFAYNKNPHDQIYVIKRLDREEGRVEVFVQGAGGAVRPTPSHDGEQLAFVRRVGLDTVLHLYDVESGKERPLYAGLDRDMQETWAIHGVYPTMAWTPDDKSIVVWAGGRILRVDVASGKATNIPFRVRDQRTVLPALRTPVEAHPDRVQTKMLRWVRVAPDGKSVVFQALGHIYVRDLPKGKVRRLTRDKDSFELYPAFSRDGKRIVYVSWNDEKLATVRVVSRRGGRGRNVTRKPGHYVEPAFTPDGSRVVFRKVSGGGVRSQLWSRDTGIYVIPAGGGEAKLVTRSGSRPHFGVASDRVYFLDVLPKQGKGKGKGKGKGGDKNRVLKSIDLDGSDERVHLESEAATEIRVSPDGRWVAFREYFDAYVAPFPPAGRPFEIGPKAEGVPISKVTRDAGEYLHWSGDSKRLYWSLGPELFVRGLEQSFAFFEGAPKELPAPADKGLDIGFSVASDVPSGKLALVGGRIVTMKGDEVIESGTVVIDRNRIVAVGPKGSVTVPSGATRIDVSGKTVLPGIVDVHAHGSQGGAGIVPQQNWLHYATLAFGVTTVHDPSNDTATIFAASEMARAGRITAPRIYSTGTILYGAKAPFKAIVDSLDDARSHLKRMKAVGAFSVKSYNQPRRDQRQQVVAAARELGMMVVPEGGSLYQHNMSMIVDGHTGIEHSLPVGRGYRDMIQLWSQTKVGYTPTLVVGYGGLFGENYWYQHTDVFAHERLRSFVPPWRIESRARRRMMASKGDWNHVEIARLCKQLADEGVKVNVGAHGQREGLAAHWELWMLVQGGMKPIDALRAATLNGAAYIGLDGDIGSIESGKLADLMVVDGNPLTNIRESERIRYVVVNGRIFDAATMNQIGNHPSKRLPFYWER